MRSARLICEDNRAVGGENTTLVVYQGDFGVFDLTGTESPSQLCNRFDDAEKPAGRSGVRVRQHSTVRIDGQLAANVCVPVGIELAASSLGAKTELLQLDYRYNREAVVELGYIDVFGPKASHPISGVARLFRTEIHQTFGADDVFMGVAFADAEQVGGLLGCIFGTLG